MKKNTLAELERLLQVRNERPERQEEIDREIWETFGETHAIAVIDLSGFSQTTVRYGIIHFLATIHRMHAIAVPAIEEGGGKIIKLEADNIFAVFSDVKVAVDCCIDLLKRAAAVNTVLPEEMDVYPCIGISYGQVLTIEESDMFGAELNLASKLGEDLAKKGEILLSETAFERLEPKTGEWEKLEFSISGLELIAYKTKVPLEK